MLHEINIFIFGIVFSSSLRLLWLFLVFFFFFFIIILSFTHTLSPFHNDSLCASILMHAEHKMEYVCSECDFTETREYHGFSRYLCNALAQSANGIYTYRRGRPTFWHPMCFYRALLPILSLCTHTHTLNEKNTKRKQHQPAAFLIAISVEWNEGVKLICTLLL